MRYYPVYLDIQNRNCMVVGGGSVSTRKVATLLDCGALVTVVSPEANGELIKLANSQSISWIIEADYRDLAEPRFGRKLGFASWVLVLDDATQQFDAPGAGA